MTRYLIVSLLALLSLTASNTIRAEVTLVEKCTTIERLAKAIMARRQEGTSISSMMEVASGDRMVMSIVRAAYSEPQYATADMQAREVTNFANRVASICFKEGMR